jgi:phosphatidylglycerol:prolipoprotein diacylglycerol transferase
LLVFCHFNKSKFVDYLDNLIVGVPLAQAIGRVGNYVNGELIGKNGEPLFAYEGILNLTLFVVLWKTSLKKNNRGILSGIYLIGYGVIRILLENLRPENEIWKLGGVPMAIIFGLIAISTGGYLIFRGKRF